MVVDHTATFQVERALPCASCNGPGGGGVPRVVRARLHWQVTLHCIAAGRTPALQWTEYTPERSLSPR